MSRDWTPRELYEFEKFSISAGHGSLWDFMENTTVTVQGKTFPLTTETALEQRKQFPLLGRLFEEYDKLYSFLSQINGGLQLLERHEMELGEYLATGRGDRDSPLIRWFEGKLDPGFYYRKTNDALFLASVQDEVGALYRFDLKQENCFWFPLTRDECISVWYSPDIDDGAQLGMKLEQRAQDGSMGAHCEILIDESLYTENLSHDAICETLHEIYDCIGHVRSLEGGTPDNQALDLVVSIPDSDIQELADKIMAVFALKKLNLEEQIHTARSRACEQPDTGANEKGQARDGERHGSR